MTVMVTGAGLIGSLAARMLADRGARVLLTDLVRPSAPADNIETAACDVRDFDRLSALIADRGITSIVHTAAVLSTGMRANPLLGLHVNFCGTANVLEAARRHGVARVVNSSSTTVLYSGFGRLPAAAIPEDVALKLVSERPASLYAITKQAAEQLCLHYRDAYGLDTVTLRFAAVLGGDLENPTSVPGRLMATLIDGARTGQVTLTDRFLPWAGTEEFVDARDCARAILHALDAETAPQGVYTIAHPSQHTLESFADGVRNVIGPFDLVIPFDVDSGFAGFPHRRPGPSDTGAAKRELAFECRHDLADSIRYWSARKQDSPAAP